MHLSERDVFVAMEIPEQIVRCTETMGGLAVCEPRIVWGNRFFVGSDDAHTRTCGICAVRGIALFWEVRCALRKYAAL